MEISPLANPSWVIADLEPLEDPPAVVEEEADRFESARPERAPFPHSAAIRPPRAVLTLAYFEAHSPEAQALAAFAKRYPNGDLHAMRALLAQWVTDGVPALLRGVDLADIDPPGLIERLCQDPHVIDLDRWLSENMGSMRAEVMGSDHRLDHLSELREAERRAELLGAEGCITVAETEIPGTTRRSDLTTEDAYLEVKTVRLPLTVWSEVTAQVADGVRKYSGSVAGPRSREVVVYAALGSEMNHGVLKGSLVHRYKDGRSIRSRADTGQVVANVGFFADMLGWLNGNSKKVPIENPGLMQTDRITIRLDGGHDAVFEREREVWAQVMGAGSNDASAEA